MSKLTSQPIMVIEDSPEDFEITARAFQKAHLLNPIIHCETAEDTFNYLYNRGRFSDTDLFQRPGIILLDLNIPGTDGLSILREIKTSPELKKTPVIILTTSSDSHDVESCYESGANSYMQKPVNMKNFVEAIERLKEYWFEVTILPR